MRTCMKVFLIAGLVCLAFGPALAGKPTFKPTTFDRGLLVCDNAIDFPCGETFAGSNVGAPANVSTYSCVGWNESGGEVVYELYLDDTYDVTVTLSNLTCDLDIFLLADCEEANCITYGDSSFSIQLNTGTYYVVVDGYNAAECGFDLTITCEAPPPPPEDPGSTCQFLSICYDWDFAVGDHGFVPEPCDVEGLPVWQYGFEAVVPGSPGNVWATILNGPYVSGAGDGLISPPFTVDPDCDWMEIKHYVYTEGYLTGSGNIYDGGNVTVDEIVIPPVEGYDGVCNSGLPDCVYQEEVFAGDITAGIPQRTWTTSCFDLSQFMGMTIRVRFDFGSDSSVTRPGWYLAYVRIGDTQGAVSDEDMTWGGIKSLYR